MDCSIRRIKFSKNLFRIVLISIALSKGTDIPLLAVSPEESIVIAEDTIIRMNRRIPEVEVWGHYEHSYKSNFSNFSSKTEKNIKDIPLSVSTITSTIIREKMQYSLCDVVSDVAGVGLYSGYEEFTIRGFRAENARTINGLRGYNTLFNSLLLANIEKVEIVKGPLGSLYGNGDPGGSINLVTKRPLDERRNEIDFSAGSRKHFRLQGDFTGPLTKNKKLLYRFNVAADRSDSYRKPIKPEYFIVAPSLLYIINEKIDIATDFSVTGIRSMIDRGQPGIENNHNLKTTHSSLTLSQKGDYLKETDISSQLRLNWKISDKVSLHSGYLNYITNQKAGEHGFHSYITPDSVNLFFRKWDYETMTNSLSNYLDIKFRTGFLHHNVIAGYDFIHTKADIARKAYEKAGENGSGIASAFSLTHPDRKPVDTAGYILTGYYGDGNPEADTYSTHGIYAQDEIIWKDLRIFLGLRSEFYKGTDDDDEEEGEDDDNENFTQTVLLPRIGISYSITPQISVYATYNKGFDPYEANGSRQIFKSKPKPFKSTMWEAGIKGNFLEDKLSAAVAVYHLKVDNVAVSANDPSEPDLYVQRGRDISKGIETEIKGSPYLGLNLSLNYAYNIARTDKSENPEEVGLIKENAPKHISNLWISYCIQSGFVKGLSVAIGYSAVSKRNTLDTRTTLPGYFILNAAVSYRYSNLALSLNIENITGREYWTTGYNNINKWPGEPVTITTRISYVF